MKKAIVWFSVVGYFLLPVWMKIPVIGEYLAVFFVFFPMFLTLFYLLFVWLPNSTWEPSGYSQRDLDDARHEGRQQGIRDGRNGF